MILEDILTIYNRKLTFKVLAFMILSLPAFQFSSQMQNILLSVVTPNFTCQYNNVNKYFISSDQCSINVNGSIIKCTNWKFSQEPVGSTMVSDYGLVCDYKNLGDIILVMWYITSLTGPIMGWLSDRFGRKVIVIFNLCLETIASISLSFAPNVGSNIFFRICIGISANGFYTCYVWLIEMVDNEYREFVGSFIWFYGCLAYMVFPLTAYVSKNWRTTQLLSLIPSFLYIAILFVPESPRWSCVNDRKPELMESLKKIAKINKIEFKIVSDDIYVEKTVEDRKILSALKENTFTFRICIGFLSVFSINLLYSAIAVNLNILSHNIYISMFLLGLMELPGVFLSYFSLRYLKRKTSFLTIGGFGATLIFISVFFTRSKPWQSVVRIVLGCLAKIAVTSSNQSTMVYVSELCPTTHRSMGFASIQIANLLSFTAAVYINKLTHIYFFLPMMIYFISLWVTCIIMYVSLPETKNLPIPETLLDQKMLKNGKEDEFLIYMHNKNSEKLYVSETSSSERDSYSSNEETQLIDKKK